MKRSTWFQTDLGFEATRQKLRQSKDVIGDMECYKGILTFYFKDMKDFTIQITTQGKLGIFYPETASYENILERLKPFLVQADGSPIRKFQKKEPEKPSTEIVKTEADGSAKLNFWAYLKWKREYEDEQLDKSIKQLKEERKQLKTLMGLKE